MAATEPKSSSPNPSHRKMRLDRLLLERGLLESRSKAQALIMAGRVLVAGQKVEKAGALVGLDSPLEILGEERRYAGRGGNKLEAALAAWDVNVAGAVCLDIGSSTGGFVDCLLQGGATRVHAVDVGTGQMDWRLRQDPRVKLHERTNARYLPWELIGETVDLVTVDVSFISATRILPALIQFCRPGTRLLALVKPQFEAGKGKVGKGGIVRDEALRQEAVEKVRRCAAELGFGDFRVLPCPVLGAEGNQEFFLSGFFHPPADLPEQ